MVKIQKSIFVLGFGCVLGLSLGPAMAALPEWNPVRAHGVEIGPEASRLIVGFKASSDNAVIKTVQRHSRAYAVKITQARTTAADVETLLQRTGYESLNDYLRHRRSSASRIQKEGNEQRHNPQRS